MKLSKSASLLVLALAVAVAGCTKSKFVTPLPEGGAGGAKTGTEPGIGSGGRLTEGSGIGDGVTGLAANPANAHLGWLEDASVLKPHTVYFAFDSSEVRASEKSKLVAVADYLKAHEVNAVRVEGNCDERGTAEYNRALGERRALAVREELAKLGIDPKRVDTISYGFDRPVDTGHSQTSWAMNRRDEFILLSPPR
jgi:peptidoglycan-associated lipoprotein